MKKYTQILFLFAFAASVLSANAQLRTKTVRPLSKGSFDTYGIFPNTITGLGTADTLAVSDTIAYIIPVNGANQYMPFLSMGWTKIGAGTATVTASFYQGNSPYNFVSVKAGSANTAYTKTFTLSASGTNFVDFLSDSAKISGRYLKVQYLTTSTANVSGSVVTVVNTSIR